jgi:hypothetical protein
MQKPVLEHATTKGRRKAKSTGSLTPTQPPAMSLESVEDSLGRQNPSSSSADFTLQLMELARFVWFSPKHRNVKTRFAGGPEMVVAIENWWSQFWIE